MLVPELLRAAGAPPPRMPETRDDRAVRALRVWLRRQLALGYVLFLGLPILLIGVAIIVTILIAG